jgi:hypothetical protein
MNQNTRDVLMTLLGLGTLVTFLCLAFSHGCPHERYNNCLNKGHPPAECRGE